MEPGTSNYKSFTLSSPKQSKQFASADPQANGVKSHHKILNKQKIRVVSKIWKQHQQIKMKCIKEGVKERLNVENAYFHSLQNI